MWMSPKAVVPPNHPHHGWPWLRPWKGRTIKTYGGFLKWGYPKIIQFDRIFHDNPSSYGSKLSKKPKVAFGSAADLEIHLCTSKEAGSGVHMLCVSSIVGASINGEFLKWMVYHGLSGQILLKWIIWGYPHLWKRIQDAKKHDMMWNELSWHDLMWCDMVRCDLIWSSIYSVCVAK